MDELTVNVNWIAVLVGTVLSFILGWAWYSAKLFGVKWAEGSRVELATSEQPMNPTPLIVQLVGTFLLAWLIGVTAASDKLMTAFLILITIAVMIAGMGLFVKKSRYAVFADVGFVIAMGVVMIACQGLL